MRVRNAAMLQMISFSVYVCSLILTIVSSAFLTYRNIASFYSSIFLITSPYSANLLELFLEISIVCIKLLLNSLAIFSVSFYTFRLFSSCILLATCLSSYSVVCISLIPFFMLLASPLRKPQIIFYTSIFNALLLFLINRSSDHRLSDF